MKGISNCTFNEAEDLDSHKVGAAKGDGRICRIEGVELDMVLIVDHLFDQGFLAIDEDDGYAAAIDAILLMHLDNVAVLDLRRHTVAGDLDTDGFVCFAIGVDVYGHIFGYRILGDYAEACTDRFIDGDHAGFGGVEDDGVAVEGGGGLGQSGDRDAEVVGDLFEGGVSRNCAVFPFGNASYCYS